MDKECRICETILVAPINWYPSSERDHKYMCKTCDNARRLARISPEERERRLRYGRNYRELNPELCAQQTQAYGQSERGRALRAQREAVRRAKKLHSTISEELEDIKEFYRNRPDGYHVDHIIPLSRGGTHTLDNLQYLPARDNILKSNKLPGEY